MIKRIIEKLKKKLGLGKKKTKEKKKEKKMIDLDILLPEEYREHFEAVEVIEKKNEWNLKVYEKEDNIPSELKGKEIVSNGFCNRLEVVDYPFRCKPIYLHIYRRRWKEKGTSKSYENQHKLHPEGMKVTVGFGNFLKELSRQEYREYVSAWPDIRYLRKEAF